MKTNICPLMKLAPAEYPFLLLLSESSICYSLGKKETKRIKWPQIFIDDLCSAMGTPLPTNSRGIKGSKNRYFPYESFALLNFQAHEKACFVLFVFR